VAGVEFVPLSAQFFGGAPLMGLAGIFRLAAEEDRSIPVLIPEILEYDGRVLQSTPASFINRISIPGRCASQAYGCIVCWTWK
jgi:hypothetical protein